MLLVGHVPGCGKPFLKRNPAAVEDRPCRDRDFTTTSRARPAPICCSPTLCALALGAANTGWPSQLLQRRGARRLISKPVTKLLPGSWIRRVNFPSWWVRQHYLFRVLDFSSYPPLSPLF